MPPSPSPKPNQHVQIIHIGKCGGSSIRTELEKSPVLSKVLFEYVHISKPKVDNSYLYYIIARDPLKRSISAFNWRYHIVVEKNEQVGKFDREEAVLRKYVYLNNLAESLYHADGTLNLQVHREFNKIHHLKQRISYYLCDLLDSIDTSQVLGVIMTESIADDMLDLFNVPVPALKRKRNIRIDDMQLTQLGRQNLVKYLWDDYACLLELYNAGMIRPFVIEKIFRNFTGLDATP